MGLLNFRMSDVFVVPVTGAGLVHLPQDGTILAVDAIQFLIGVGAQVGIRSLDVGLQLAAGQFLHFAIHFQFEDIAVRDRII